MALEGAAEMSVFFDADEHGMSAEYWPIAASAPIETVVILDPSLEAMPDGERTLVTDDRRIVAVRLDQVGAPRKGDSLVIADERYTVAEIVASDELVATLRIY